MSNYLLDYISVMVFNHTPVIAFFLSTHPAFKSPQLQHLKRFLILSTTLTQSKPIKKHICIWTFAYWCFHRKHQFSPHFLDTSESNECLLRRQAENRFFFTDCQYFCISPFDSADNKRRTRYAQKTMNPEWNQTVIYKNIHLEQVLCINTHVHTHRHTHADNFQTPCSCAPTAHAVGHWGWRGRLVLSLEFSLHVLSLWCCAQCPCATSSQHP